MTQTRRLKSLFFVFMVGLVVVNSQQAVTYQDWKTVSTMNATGSFKITVKKDDTVKCQITSLVQQDKFKVYATKLADFEKSDDVTTLTTAVSAKSQQKDLTSSLYTVKYEQKIPQAGDYIITVVYEDTTAALYMAALVEIMVNNKGVIRQEVLLTQKANRVSTVSTIYLAIKGADAAAAADSVIKIDPVTDITVYKASDLTTALTATGTDQNEFTLPKNEKIFLKYTFNRPVQKIQMNLFNLVKNITIKQDKQKPCKDICTSVTNALMSSFVNDELCACKDLLISELKTEDTALVPVCVAPASNSSNSNIRSSGKGMSNKERALTIAVAILAAVVLALIIGIVVKFAIGSTSSFGMNNMHQDSGNSIKH